jgi:DNA-binding SARP family transcriptional activator
VEAGALYHLLAVDMVLAQAAWEEGALDEAVEYLALHESYILSESSNWQIAMYVRAFPALLSVVARAVGVSEVPIHLLRLVPTEQAEAALAVADRLLTSEEVQSLAARLGAAVSDGSAAEQTERPLAPCRVKLFGGLEVTTEAGVVEDSAWQKRKSRLLFAMLVVRRGQDLPRDVILEYLWPNMDDARARNNFYVIWSTMKRALENADGSGGPASRFVKSSGGLCRVTRLVRSDLDDFEETVGNLRSAQAAGDGAAVLVHARRLMEIYRGELLPGDLYDDWFAETRDRIRHDFCDAMLSAARVAEARNELDHALVLLRSASAADPWREDVYQTTMRCQMSAGQRSRAIETYLSCRTRLVDDLGIDPSAETTRLYQAILAMEDEGARGSGGWSKGS